MNVRWIYDPKINSFLFLKGQRLYLNFYRELFIFNFDIQLKIILL